MNDEFEPIGEPVSSEPQTPAAVDGSQRAGRSGWKIAAILLLSAAAVALLILDIFLGILLLRDRKTDSSEPRVLSTGEVAEQVSPAVVLIQATTATSIQYGTGFFVRSDGYILTNYHVVEGAKSIRITLYPGEKKKTAVIVGSDKEMDLALLYVRGSDFPTVTIGNSDLVAVGDTAILIGNPSGEKCAWTVSQGIISAKRLFTQDSGGMTTENKMIQTDAPVNHGNSGGPLLNDRGEVIGVISKKLLDSDGKTVLEGIGLAIPINEAMDVARKWMDE